MSAMMKLVCQTPDNSGGRDLNVKASIVLQKYYTQNNDEEYVRKSNVAYSLLKKDD